MNDPHGLNVAQRRFANEYLADFNASAAARRAGYGAKNSDVVGPRLLGHVGISAAIADALKVALNRPLSDVDSIILEATRLAHSDIRKAFDEAGNLLNVTDLPDDIAAAISSVEVMMKPGQEKGTVVQKLRLWDKNAAIALLARYHKMLTDKVEHSGGVEMTYRDVETMDTSELLQELQQHYEQTGKFLASQHHLLPAHSQGD